MTQHPSDITAQKTFLGPDDIAFRNHQKRKRAPKDALPSIPDGPCCARCANWQRPDNGDEFGMCREVVVDMSVGTDVRRFVTRKEAREQFVIWTDPMATRGFFAACSLFRRNVAEGAA